jgi:hypothetical protein
MSDINEMARGTAHVIAAEAKGAPLTQAHLEDVFVRGALWAMTRSAHAVAITRTAAREGAERTGVERAQRAIATTHQGMIEARRP